MRNDREAEEMQRIYRGLVGVFEKRALYTVSKVWEQAFGIVGVMVDERGLVTVAVAIGSRASQKVYACEGATPAAAVGGALAGWRNANELLPEEADLWFRTMMAEFETNHLAEKPN